MAFESTKNIGNTWNPTKEENGDPKEKALESDFIDGFYVSKKEGVGQHNANVYTIEKKDGEQFNVWGTTALNAEMDKVRQGQFVRIQWLGKLLTKKGADKPAKQRVSTDSFHAWEVFVDKDVAPMDVNQMEPKSQHNTAVAQSAGKDFAKEENPFAAAGGDDLPF